MKKLVQIYDAIRQVNRYICKKLISVGTQDASINALVRLDFLADPVDFVVDDYRLDEIEALFGAYLDEK